MQLLDELTTEHALIERVLGSLRGFVELRARGEGDPLDGLQFVRFFRDYAGRYHHDREENLLFAALVERAELPAHRGPLAVMTADHADLAILLDRLEPLLKATTLDTEASRKLQDLARAYSHALWHHIDAEDSVLFPESAARFRRAHVLELPSRPPTSEEQEACFCGERMVEKYPPIRDREILRGDGCVHCPAFGTTCRGLEREWWNEWEWEEFEDTMPKD